MLALREDAGLIEGSGIEVDDVQDNFASRGQKRKRDLSGDMPGQHSPPKFRRVEHDGEQTSSSSCRVAVPEAAACSQLISDTEGSVTGKEIKGDGTAEEGTASSNACLPGSAMAMDALAWTGVRLDQLDNEGNAPLHLAARYGNTETVRSLLARGAQHDMENGNGNTPLHLAAHSGHAEVVDLLLRAGARVNQPDGDGDTPLHLAASEGAVETVKILLAAGPCIDQVNSDNSTPLHLAILNGHAGVVDLLIKAGASIHQPDGDNDMPLHLAAHNGHAEVVDLLLKAGAQVNQPDGDGDMPLHRATFKVHAEAMDLLLKAGAQVNQPDCKGDMPLHRATFKGHTEAMDLLLKAGAQVDPPSGEGNTPLHLAIFKEHAEAVVLLLKAGAQVNHRGGKGNMPLHRAAHYGNAETVRLLLTLGAHVNPVNDVGNMPLHVATIYKHAEVVDLLLKAGAPVNQPDGDGDTPVHLATSEGAVETLRILLAAGPWIDLVNPEGATPLHLAASRGNAEAVDLLLKAGAEITLTNNDGFDALHLAISNGHANVVRLLLGTRIEIACCRLAAGPPGPYKNMVSEGSLADGRLVRALGMATTNEDAAMVELLLAHAVLPLLKNAFPSLFPRAFPIALPTPLAFPIHDLLLCGPLTAPVEPAVAPDMMSTLVSIFEACATAQMTPKEIDDTLRAAGLLSPVVDELAGQFCWAPQLKQAIAGNAPLTRAQVRQALGGMLGELEQCMNNWPQPYGMPKPGTAPVTDETGIGTPVSWISEEGQAHLTSSLEKQVQALSEMGRQSESDALGEGVSDLLALCLEHMPVENATNAAALRHVLTAKLGMYGSLADKTVQAWQATLATRANGAIADASTLGTFAQQLQAQLSGAATYSRVRSSSAIDEAAAQIMTQLMIRQWTMLEQYWNGAAAEAVQ
jgi:ankyrin repeat protein